MQRTHAYWKDCRANDRPMTLTSLANCLVPHDPSLVLDYLTDEAHGLAGEFPAPPPKVMKKFMKFTFAKSGLRLEFDRNDWLGNITVREQSVTIRNAPPELIRMIDDEKHGR
jgi:nucleoid-associated protein YejK